MYSVHTVPKMFEYPLIMRDWVEDIVKKNIMMRAWTVSNQCDIS